MPNAKLLSDPSFELLLEEMYMPLCTINSVLAAIFTIVVLISANDSDDTLRNLNWSNGDVGNGLDTVLTTWISIYQYGIGNDDDLMKVDWTSPYCEDPFCSDCKSAMKIVLAFLCLFFILTIVSVIASSYRCIPTGNTTKARYTCIFISLVSVGFGLVSILKYALGCEKKMKDYLYDYYDITWYYGPAFCLLVAAVSLSFINLWCHWRTPINEELRTEEYNRGLLDTK